jgi:hypothetical protein
MEIASYHELSNYTNIYSLSLLDHDSLQAPIISTCKSLHYLTCNPDGFTEVHRMIPNSLHEVEILGQDSYYSQGKLTIALICKARSHKFFIQVHTGQSLEDINDEGIKLSIEYIPYKILVVRSIQVEIINQLVVIVTGNDCNLHCTI